MRKPSFMAIIAELITLWRLQTCVISIFPSSHLAHRLENASMGRVNLATAQPSPFSPVTFLQPFLSWSSPRPHSAALLPGHSDAFPALLTAPPLSAAFGNGEFPPLKAAELGQARTWQVLLLPVQMTPQRSWRQFSDK